MKIIIPVIDDKYGKNEIASDFHNSDFICIYDSGKKTYEWLPITEISKSPGNLSVELKKKGIEAVICSFMSIMAVKLFTESNIKIFKSNGSNLKNNIELLSLNVLKPYTIQLALGSAACVGSCTSCNSICN